MERTNLLFYLRADDIEDDGMEDSEEMNKIKAKYLGSIENGRLAENLEAFINRSKTLDSKLMHIQHINNIP